MWVKAANAMCEVSILFFFVNAWLLYNTLNYLRSYVYRLVSGDVWYPSPVEEALPVWVSFNCTVSGRLPAPTVFVI